MSDTTTQPETAETDAAAVEPETPDTIEAPDTTEAAAEPETAEAEQPTGMTDAAFAALAEVVMTRPAPAYDPLPVLPGDVRKAWNTLVDEFHQNYDQLHLHAFWRDHDNQVLEQRAAEIAAQAQAEAEALSGATA